MLKNRWFLLGLGVSFLCVSVFLLMMVSCGRVVTTTVTTTSATTTTLALGSAMYCYNNGSPEGYASSGFKFIGVKGTDISMEGTIPEGRPIFWKFAYSDGETLEGIYINCYGTFEGNVSGADYTDLWDTFFSFLTREVVDWNIDSTSALSYANANASVEAWLSGKDEENIVVIASLLLPARSSLSWVIFYDYNQSEAIIQVTLSAVDGTIISFEELI